jgi:glycosyltransferase involved in cell wall biosynthesis
MQESVPGRSGGQKRPHRKQQQTKTWRLRARRLLEGLPLAPAFSRRRLDRLEAALADAIVDAEKAREESGVEGVRAWCSRVTRAEPALEMVWAEAAFTALRADEPRAALEYGERLVALQPRTTFVRNLIAVREQVGDLARAAEVAELHASDMSPSSTLRLVRLRGQLRVLHNGLDFGAPVSAPAYAPVDRRVLYLLHRSLPYSSVGYSIRSQGLISALRGLGYDVTGVTRLGFPWDEKDAADWDIPVCQTIDDVPYVRLPTLVDTFRNQPIDRFIEAYSDRVIELAKAYKPAVLHAASNFVTGAAAVRAARQLGIPSVYEVRGLWEITTVARFPYRADTDHYDMTVRAETEVAKEADQVLAITGAVKDLLVQRGVPAEKIEILPNGVDTDRFRPMEPDQALRDELGLNGKVVIGYVGSITVYEGLDYLLRAIAQLDEAHRSKLACLIVGDGQERKVLEDLSRSLGLEEIVRFTGRVPHQEVSRYYSVIDITPFPRKGMLVCELVSPLKPFEAMAMGKTLICSDVAALAEIIQDGKTGLLHRKDDPESLAQCIRRILDEPDLRRRLGAAGLEWAGRERDWKVLAERAAETYEALRVPADRSQSS